jgi:2-polyprenyl-6-methoxyphenol hydroxylase-like FAD-dependent oxidoreductase
MGALTLAELQDVVDGATGRGVRVHAPVWLSHFRLHHRQAAHYSKGRVFLAGDAGHIHSPVGAQGVNTGIQDAWNLGWKLSLVAAGVCQCAPARLLRSRALACWPNVAWTPLTVVAHLGTESTPLEPLS